MRFVIERVRSLPVAPTPVWNLQWQTIADAKAKDR
jgi:hypothetical protein